MPDEAPVAVEPRKIKQPTETPEVASTEADVEAVSPAPEKKKGLPIVPILAGLIALIVLLLLGKVVLSK